MSLPSKSLCATSASENPEALNSSVRLAAVLQYSSARRVGAVAVALRVSRDAALANELWRELMFLPLAWHCCGPWSRVPGAPASHAGLRSSGRNQRAAWPVSAVS